MAKRFIDTGIFRKPLVRSMKAPYKALFIYLLCECDHAGVWDVELDVASTRLGIRLDETKAIEELCGSVEVVKPGKWYVRDFVAFQYGDLNPANRVHASVLARLESLNIDLKKEPNKDHKSPLQGAKDKDTDKDNGSQDKERATLEQRKWAFVDQAKAVHAEKRILSETEFVKFTAYWTQAGPNDKKLHFEKQQTFEIAARMITWGGRSSSPAQPEKNAERKDLKTSWS